MKGCQTLGVTLLYYLTKHPHLLLALINGLLHKGDFGSEWQSPLKRLQSSRLSKREVPGRQWTHFERRRSLDYDERQKGNERGIV